MQAVLNVALPVFGIILCGYLAGRVKLLGAISSEALNAFVYWFALPPLIFIGMAVTPVDRILNVEFIATVSIGIVVTGSGPHAGDASTPRNGLDSELLQHYHSWPAYITFGLTLLLIVVAARVGHRSLLRSSLALLAVEGVQIVVGIAQARRGLPVLLVGVHIVLACVLVAVMTMVVLTTRKSVAASAQPSDPAREPVAA